MCFEVGTVRRSPVTALGENCYSGAMSIESRGHSNHSDARPEGAPAARAIAGGNGWGMAEYTCCLGPHDRPFEEQHEEVTIAAVVEGSFQYRCDAGQALLHPGAFMLGNAGRCFECGHEHGTGDRCIALHFAPSYFEEIAATAAGTSRFRFPAAKLPMARARALPVIQTEIVAGGGAPIVLDEWATTMAETVIATLSGVGDTGAAPSARDQRRISVVLRHMEDHADGPLDLDGLAGVAVMSKYHFLRTFRRVVGMTPYQFLLDVRMRRAAVRLCTTPEPIGTIAFDAGFGDLSTFNGRFRSLFGMSPGAFRKARALG